MMNTRRSPLTTIVLCFVFCASIRAADEDVVVGRRRDETPAVTAPQKVSAPNNHALAESALDTHGAQREKALRALALLSAEQDRDGAGVLALARVAVRDDDAALRALAGKALAARADARILAPLAQAALENKDAQIRQNAAGALAAIGGPPVLEIVVEHWKEVWGGSARSHTFFGRSQSYVSGYNISGDSYEPVVSTFLTGEVLDVKVIKVERDIYVTTLRWITGDAKFPENPNAWDTWIEKNGPRLAEAAAAKRAEALAELRE